MLPLATREAVEKVAGVSHDAVRKVEKILEHATPAFIAAKRSGEMYINAAAKTVAPPKPTKQGVVAAEPAVTTPTPVIAADPDMPAIQQG